MKKKINELEEKPLHDEGWHDKKVAGTGEKERDVRHTAGVYLESQRVRRGRNLK